MQRLTVAGRLLITALILAAIYFGLKYIGGIDLFSRAKTAQTTETAGSTSMPDNTDETSPGNGTKDGSTITDVATDNGGSSASTENGSASNSAQTTDGGQGRAFTFTPPAPTNGKLKGVVELGASGFNSFIVTIDAQKNWKLEKADFGNSLVMENMATDQDVRDGLKKYIATMLDFGVSGRDIQFVVSSGAVKAEGTQKIIRGLKSLNFVVNTVTPEQEGKLALRSVLPDAFTNQAFVVDIGSGNTKVSWVSGGQTSAIDSYGAKYFQDGTDDAKVYDEVKAKVKAVPTANRKTAFIIGGIPFELAKQIRNGKERYTVLKAPGGYTGNNAKQKAGLNIYKAIADATGCEQFVFDWDANFTIGYLLTLK
jgi:hypothetical protein